MEDFGNEEKLRLLLQDFQAKLNKEPDPREFERVNGIDNLPISFVEMTLDEIYLGLWGTENFTWSAITNEVQGSLELVLVHPITRTQIRRVGAGSIVIMVDSLSEEDKNRMSKQDRNLFALNPENKKPNALDAAFPKLKAECVKNAAKSLGKIFGRDINRKNKDVFKPPLKPISDKALLAAIERVENGQLETIPLAEANFLLTEEQKTMLYGAKQKLLK